MLETRTYQGRNFTIFEPGFVNPKADKGKTFQDAVWQIFIGPGHYYKVILNCPKCGRIEDVTGFPVELPEEVMNIEGEDGPYSNISCDDCGWGYWPILKGWARKGMNEAGEILDRKYWEEL